MPRVRRGPKRKDRRTKILKLAKGYYGARSRLYKTAKDAVIPLGKKVKISVRFRGREIVHLDYGRRILDRIREEIGADLIVEQEPRKDGRFLDMVVAPRAPK